MHSVSRCLVVSGNDDKGMLRTTSSWPGLVRCGDSQACVPIDGSTHSVSGSCTRTMPDHLQTPEGAPDGAWHGGAANSVITLSASGVAETSVMRPEHACVAGAPISSAATLDNPAMVLRTLGSFSERHDRRKSSESAAGRESRVLVASARESRRVAAFDSLRVAQRLA